MIVKRCCITPVVGLIFFTEEDILLHVEGHHKTVTKRNLNTSSIFNVEKNFMSLENLKNTL